MSPKRIGRYEIEKSLGAGSMAVVYKAIDPLIGRTVAIKTIRFDASLGFELEELRERFYREAKNAGILIHPNIVTIFDIGAEGETDFIVMEYVEGQSLHQWLAQNPIPPIQQTIDIIQQIAAGLDYAAAHGIIHRDIKPANILLNSGLIAKIADFGIAKAATSKLTQTGAVIGSPSYMSPEQAMGLTLDGRSDIFSLGIIFYEMLTGEKPFSGKNPSTIIYKILHQEPVQPQQLNVTLHPAFNQIMGRMLAKDPDKRYQKCSELIQDLKNYPSMTLREEKPQTPAPTPAPAPFAAKAQPTSGRRYGVFAFMLLILAGITAAAGYFYYWKPRQSVLQNTAAVQTTAPAPRTTETNIKPTDISPSEQTTPGKEPAVQDPQGVNPQPSSESAQQAVTEKESSPTDQQPAGMTALKKTAAASSKPADLSAFKKAEKKAAVDQELTRPAEEKPTASPKKQMPAKDESAWAEVRLEFSGATYPVTVYDGATALKELSASNLSIQIGTGNHRFRLVSDDGFVDQKLDHVRLSADQVYTISVPALGSAFIEVPNDAYDGCTIQLDGRTLSAPYPAQIPRLPAGNHKILFHWNSGKYAGKELASGLTTEANHHYRIRGEPAGDKVVVQQIR